MLHKAPTSREVLALFMPYHDMHNVADFQKTRDESTVICTCGARLYITRATCKSFEVSYDAVIAGLRNAPRARSA